ncbi:asparagine synthase (glutamine-hydrolyzing) [Pistricoccus aurantiacus]|uniref:asparagine synthase (glutamine-hydrolyzing) n=1 Tax=Pistricoccus aurantiacus TaxID=1883414 RepID=UPI0036338F3D
MCGLVGFFSGVVLDDPQAGFRALRRMTNAITHRGPDSEGYWADEPAGLVLGHRRLSILDLSPAGHQPMHSACGRYVIAFNGEIYNHLDLRARLERDEQAPVWRGHADTETLLAAFAAWGVVPTLETAVGMFAIALWDRQQQSLVLARDRFGEKPLYYGFQGDGWQEKSWQGASFLFGSELKALAAHPQWQGELETDALENYLRFGCVRGEQSIFRDIFKLPPGTMLTLSRDQAWERCLPEPTLWWSVQQAAGSAIHEGRITDPTAGIDTLEQALRYSIGQRMVADVPLGAFLSGGVDSSTVVALMQAQTERPVRTFSVGFDDARYDESSHAEAVAAHLGTEHMTLKATSKMALDLVPRLPEIYDEPFADSSQLPTALVSRLTREHVTVALSGDGGDELFGGYNRHLWVPRIWRKLKRLPLPARRALALTLETIPTHAYDRIMQLGGRILPSRLRLRTFGEKLHKLAAVLESPSQQALFAGVSSMNRTPSALLASSKHGNDPETLYPALTQFDNVEWMLLMDTLHYMVDDVLVKVDRASMASSLEVRVPFLDPGVFRAAWRLPPEIKLREGQGKWVLRQVLYRHVPCELIERPKMGFAIPLDDWLRGPLREWAEDLLSSASLDELPMLDAHQVCRLWQAHLKGQGHYAQQLWTVLQLLAWQRRWQSKLP